MIAATTLADWLSTLPAAARIGIDDGGITLFAVTADGTPLDAQFEVGGLRTPQPDAIARPGVLPGYRGTVIFSDHYPDAEGDHAWWFTLPDAPDDDQDGRLEDEHLDPVREALLAVVLHGNPHPPLFQAHADPVDGRIQTYAAVTAVDDVLGHGSTVWVLLWVDDDHELTILEYADCLDAIADLRRHVRLREADHTRELYNPQFLAEHLPAPAGS